MNNGKQSEQLLKVLGGHRASLDRTSKCRGLSEQPLYSGGHKAMQHETRNWNNFDKSTEHSEKWECAQCDLSLTATWT